MSRMTLPAGWWPVNPNDPLLIVITDGVDTMTFFPNYGYVMD